VHWRRCDGCRRGRLNGGLAAGACILLDLLGSTSKPGQAWLIVRGLPRLCALLRGAEPSGPSSSASRARAADGRPPASVVAAAAAARCLAALADVSAPALAGAGCAGALLEALEGAGDQMLSLEAGKALMALVGLDDSALSAPDLPRLVALVEALRGWPIHAAMTLGWLARQEGWRPRLAAAGAVPAFCVLLARGDLGDRGMSADTLYVLCTEDPAGAGREAMSGWGVLPAAVDLLREDEKASQPALRLLATLLDEGPPAYAHAVAAAGAIPPLIQLLRDGSEAAAAYAAVVLSLLARERELRDGLLAGGVVSPLLRRLLDAVRTLRPSRPSHCREEDDKHVALCQAVATLRSLAEGRGGFVPPRLAAAVRAFIAALPEGESVHFSGLMLDGGQGDRAEALLSGLSRPDTRLVLGEEDGVNSLEPFFLSTAEEQDLYAV